MEGNTRNLTVVISREQSWKTVIFIYFSLSHVLFEIFKPWVSDPQER
jgi:hypothetical protein